MSRFDLGERPSSRDELAVWYSAALEEQAASGLSVQAYAERLGVSAWTLYQWRRRLPAAASTKRNRANLVEVTIARPNPATCASSLVVHVNEGRRSIDVPRGFDSDELRRLVEALESC